jgi:hypothetical protein
MNFKNHKKNLIINSILYYLFAKLCILVLINNRNYISSYYILPFKIERNSLEVLKKDSPNKTEDELFFIYTNKISLTTYLKINDSLTIKGFIRSEPLCSSLKSESCISDSEVVIKNNHNNINISNVFDILKNNSESKFEDDKCINMMIGLGRSQFSLRKDCLSFVDVIKKNDKTMKTYAWSIIYFNNDLKQKNNYDGEIIMGIELYGYQPSIYNENDYITINNHIDEISYDYPMYENFEYGILFNSIYFYINNKNASENLVKCRLSASMEGLFNFDKGLIRSPNEYYLLIKNNFFNQYLNLNICKEISLTQYFSRSIVCDKNKLNADEFYKSFPTLYFSHSELSYIFELTSKDLFIEKNNKIYFMISTYSDEKWYLSEIFVKKYLFSFDQDKKSIGFYKTINKNQEITTDNGNNNGNSNSQSSIGIVFLCIGIGLIIINVIIFGVCLWKKNCGVNRRRRANELKDDNYDYLADENSKKNKIINDN